MLSRYQIEAILHNELQAAMERHRDASERFKAIIDAIPSRIPAPDGSLRIRVAGRERRVAAESLHSSLVRFNQFMTDGIVPEDLT
jgi:hypothetical protein